MGKIVGLWLSFSFPLIKVIQQKIEKKNFYSKQIRMFSL